MSSISVAMGTYNGAKYISEQLDSIAKQTRLPDEVVVTDDGSTDETLAILDHFAASAPFPVRIFRNDQNLGYKANFMKCANLCNKDLIAFSDQDDIWRPEKLATQVQHFDEPSVLLSSHEVELMANDGTSIGGPWGMFPSRGAYTLTKMLPFAYNFGFTQMLRRSLLDFTGYWANAEAERSKQMAHDEFYFFIASVIGSVHFDDRPLASYRQHRQNTSGEKQRKSLVQTLSYKFDLRADDYERYIENSTERLRILGHLATDPILSEAQKEKVQQAIGCYEHLFELHSKRLKLYRSNQFYERYSVLTELVSSKNYKLHSAPWDFTLAGLIKDIIATIFPNLRGS